MKKTLMLIVMTFLTISALSQEYSKLIRSNTTWDQGQKSFFCYIYISRIEFSEKDSLIDGNYYRIVRAYPFTGDTGPGGTICYPFQILDEYETYAKIREDTLSKKVYVYDEFLFPHDQLLYDFTLSPGDTLWSDYGGLGYLVLDHINDITLPDGNIVKQFCFDPSCIIHYTESIGGWRGLDCPLTPEMGYEITELLCVKENAIPIWGHSCQNYFVSSEEKTWGKIVSYNPTGRIIHVNLDETYTINITNITGKTIYNNTETDRIISVEILPAGIYFIRISCVSNVFTVKIFLL